MTTCWLWLYFYPTDMRVNYLFFKQIHHPLSPQDHITALYT